jgi:putative transposase
MALETLLGKAQVEPDADVLRAGGRVLAQALMELEVRPQLGAGRHERTVERTGSRTGYRERQWDTREGSIPLRVPQVQDGGAFRRWWSHDGERRRRWWRWCTRRTSTA